MHHILTDVCAADVFLGGIQWWQAKLGPCSWYVNFFASHVGSSGVVLGMTEAPREVRHTQPIRATIAVSIDGLEARLSDFHSPRVNDESESIVDPLVCRERMVATLVTDAPKAKAKEASDERVQCPDRETRRGIKIGMRKGDAFRSQKLVENVGELAERNNDREVHEPARRSAPYA